MLKEFNLDASEKVFAYIQHELSRGKTLARYLRNISLYSGTVITYLPPNYTDEMSLGVKETIVVGEWPTGRPLAGRILHHLREAETNCALFEDSVGRSDEDLSSVKNTIFFYETEVYHYLNIRQFETEEAIHHTIKTIPSRPRIGVLTSLSPSESAPQDRLFVTEDCLENFAARTVALIVAAYDNTSHLIWLRNQD